MTNSKNVQPEQMHDDFLFDDKNFINEKTGIAQV